MTPRDIITQAIAKFDWADGPYYKHRHLLRGGEVTAEYRDAMRADLAERILDALAAAGLVVIDPANLKTGDQVVDGDGYTGTIIRFELCALIEYDRPTYFDPQAERWPIGQLRPIQLESSGGEATP